MTAVTESTMRRAERQEMLREMAAETGVPLYRRYSDAEAAAVLGLTAAEVLQLRRDRRIAHLRLSAETAAFFGFQLLEYLLDCMTTVEVGAEPTATPSPSAPATLGPRALNPAVLLMPVDEAASTLGIGRTKLYQLIGEGQLEAVKLGRRTLLTTESVRRLAGAS